MKLKYLDLFTPFAIVMSFGFFLGFITAYMIFKIKELEFQNKILEQRILQETNRNIVKRKKNEPIKEEKKDKEENKEEDKKEEEKNEEEEKKENDEKTKLNTVENIIKEEPKKPGFKPPEIKERKVQEEEWTEIRRKGKKKKPH